MEQLIAKDKKSGRPFSGREQITFRFKPETIALVSEAMKTGDWASRSEYAEFIFLAGFRLIERQNQLKARWRIALEKLTRDANNRKR